MKIAKIFKDIQTAITQEIQKAKTERWKDEPTLKYIKTLISEID